MSAIRWIYTAAIPLLLAGCAANPNKEASDSKALKIEAREIINQREQQIAEHARLGPVVADAMTHSQQQQRRTFIGKEEQQNYLEVKTSDSFPISLQFDKVEVHQAFALFAEIIERNILVGDEVSGEISARIHNVPWDKALDALLNMKDLAKHVDHEANIIRIHKRNILVGQESFNRQRAEALKQAQQLKETLEPLHTEIFQLHYAEPEQVKEGVESVLATLTGGGRTTITVDQRTRSLIVQSSQQNLDLVERLVARMDQRTEQVLIEAYIVEVKDSFREEFGARLGMAYRKMSAGYRDFEMSGTNAPTVVSSHGGGESAGEYETTLASAGANDIFNHLISGGSAIGLLNRTGVFDLKLELSALEADGITNIISNPRVFTLDNTVATIEQGDQIPYKSSTADGVPTTEFKDAKVSLQVTPSIVGDGNLLLDLEVHKDSVEAQNVGSEPPITQRIIKTQLLVSDRSTVVIGGIYTQTTTEATQKVPFLGDLPGIGALFRKETDNDERKELMIFISPYIV